MHSEYSKASSGEKISVELEYFVEIKIGALIATNISICILWEE